MQKLLIGGTILQNLFALKEKIKLEGLDGLLVAKPSNRLYLSGFTGSGGVLLITPETQVLITDFRYREQAQAEAPNFRIVQQGTSFCKTLGELAQELALSKLGLENDYVTIVQFEEYVRELPNIKFIPLADLVLSLRRIKTLREVENIKKAVAIADRAFYTMRDFIRAGRTEKEIALELDFHMRRLGAEKNAFPTIAASGERGALPHGAPTDKIIRAGEMLTLDYGAVFQGYCSDITRTFILGQPNEKQKEIYQLVLAAQIATEQAIQPGMRGNEADRIARDMIREAGYGDYFGHGLGHAVGLDIHEEPRLSPRDESILEPGMIVSVEPGIYLPGWGGVRVEDLVLVTAKGCQVLTQSPKTLEDMIIY